MSGQAYPTDRPAVVTCGLPYANGDLHIGHLRGYIGADVLTRALRAIGQQTAYVCGSDMHGTPVAVNAEEEGVDPETFALEWHEQYRETFPAFDVDFDNYGHTHDETNVALTTEIVEALEAGGHVYEREIRVAYDPTADQYLPDRYVVGTCPYCGARARGDECDEGCQRHLEPGEVEDPRSTITDNPAEYREREHKFFRVSAFEDTLTAFLDDLEGTANARNQPRQWIEDGLQDWCITRDMDWGVPYPDDSDLVLYVWVDAPIEYISSTKQYSERVGAGTYDWERVWRDDGEIVHVIGRDIIQHHTIFWPAMLAAAGFQTPRAVAATGFITIDGKGLSTSRNRAIWAREYLETGLHTDLLRYYLTTSGGLQQDVDFSWSAFQETVNGDLVGTIGNFWYRSLLFAHRHYGGTPDASVSPAVEDRIESAIEAVHEAVNDYAVRGVGQAALELARFGNEYIQRNEPWKTIEEDPAAAAGTIRDCVQLAKAIAVVAHPVVPATATRLWNQLGEDGPVPTVEASLEAPPDRFEEPVELFEPIEDDRVAELTASLEARIEDASDESGDEGADERIPIETFEALDLRVGRIEVAEPVPEADELARLEVDIGEEVRQVVAGIAPHHDLASLPGTRCVVLANLEPAELFGLESDGMLLAAGEEATLLAPRGDAEPGDRIR